MLKIIITLKFLIGTADQKVHRRRSMVTSAKENSLNQKVWKKKTNFKNEFDFENFEKKRGQGSKKGEILVTFDVAYIQGTTAKLVLDTSLRFESWSLKPRAKRLRSISKNLLRNPGLVRHRDVQDSQQGKRWRVFLLQMKTTQLSRNGEHRL